MRIISQDGESDLWNVKSMVEDMIVEYDSTEENGE